MILALLLAPACASRRDFAVPRAPAPVRAASSSTGRVAADGSFADVSLATELPLTASRAVALALERNADLEAARARVDAAVARLAAARATLGPRLAADASYLAADAPSSFLFKSIDARTLSPGTDFNDPGPFDNVEAGVTARWNLWNGGRDRLGLWAAEAELRASRADRASMRNEIVAAVLQALVDARAAAELEAADAASERSVEAQVAELRVLVEGGGALRSDLLSLEVRLAEARERRIRTGVALRMAKAALRDLLVLPAGQEVSVAAVAFEEPGLPGSRDEALAEAFRERRELEAVRDRIEAARIRVEAARRTFWPSVDLQARVFGDDGDARLDFERANWIATVGVSWELFDGGSRRAALHEARAVLHELEAGDRRRLSRVALEVELAWLRLEEARARLAVAASAVGAAEETFALVEKQYRGGAATVTRYLEAESERTRARTARIRARLDVDRAAFEASRAIGRLGSQAWRGLDSGPPDPGTSEVSGRLEPAKGR